LGVPVVPDVITQNAGSEASRHSGVSGAAGFFFHAASSPSRLNSRVCGEALAMAPAASSENSASITSTAGRTIETIFCNSSGEARLDIATAMAPIAIAAWCIATRSGVSSISMPTRSFNLTPASRSPAAYWLTRATRAP
jgi:hypothetical protein